MPQIYRKTAKGQAEVDTRQWRLQPRLRGLLILIDGRRDASNLGVLLQQPADTLLAILVEQGFIENLAGPAAASAARPSPPIRVPAGPPPQPPAATAKAAAPVRLQPGDAKFDSRRQQAVHALHDELGADGRTLAERMAQASNADELRPLVAQAAQLVASLRGRPAAEVYAMRFLAG